MPKIKHEVFIHAPIERCFDLARDVDTHLHTSSKTNEKAIDGKVKGLLEEGDTVTWEGTHFCMVQKLTAEITYMKRPYRFEDVMVRGAFRTFTHNHTFVQEFNGTIMIDTFEYTSPFGLIGVIADKLFLKEYMRKFIVSRAVALKEIAEKTSSI